jgi:RHS repeat-associated protein
MQDAQGNISALAVEGGTMIERATQTPYGVPTVRAPDSYAPVPAATHEWRYFHQGLRLDSSGELYDNRARMYSPYYMRFIQNDPLGLEPDPNMYRYVGNGPVGRTDPSGLQEPAKQVQDPLRNIVIQRGIMIDMSRNTCTGGYGIGPSAYAGPSLRTQLRSASVVLSDAASSLKDSVYGSIDTVQTALDIVGTADPTPLSDGINGLIYLVQGEWKWAGVSFAAAFLPYAGDAAKVGKYGRAVMHQSDEVAGAGGGAAREAAQALPPIHGNSLTSARTAYLYRLEDAEGNFLKWGVTQDMTKRYPKWYLEGKRMVPWSSGTRADMIRTERGLVETQPGPWNHKRWAGRRLGDLP